MAVQCVQIQECVDRLRKELDSVVSFWTAHSHDEVNGYINHHVAWCRLAMQAIFLELYTVSIIMVPPL